MESKSLSWVPKSIDHSIRGSYHHFDLDENGGRLKLPFCTVIFPTQCVLARMALRICAVYAKSRNENFVQVTPAIYCSMRDSFEAVSFEKLIDIEVTTLSDWTDSEIQIQVTEHSEKIDWKKLGDIPVTRNQNSISFSLLCFAGVRAVIGRPAFPVYHCVYVKRPTGVPDPRQQHFCVLLHSHDTEARNIADCTLNSPVNEIVIDRQLIVIGPPYKFRARLWIPEMMSKPREIEFDIPVSRETFNENFMIVISKGKSEPAISPGESLSLQYEVSSFGSSCKKPYAFYWNKPLIASPVHVDVIGNMAINASGSHSIGIQQSLRCCQSEQEFRICESPQMVRGDSAPDLLGRAVSGSVDNWEDGTNISTLIRDLSVHGASGSVDYSFDENNLSSALSEISLSSVSFDDIWSSD